MAIIVELPRLSDTMEEGVIAKWHVSEGDKVKRGQVIADIETDKATMEFESFDAGVVLKLVAPEGETLALGAPIAVLGKKGEDVGEALASHAPAPAAEAGEPSAAASPAPASVPTSAAAPPVAATTATPAPRRDNGRIPASPIARRLAREAGLSLDQIQGSGPHGRIVKTDVEAAAEGGAPRPAPGGPPVSRADTPQKLSQMRKAIARRMSQANAEIPHFYLTIIADMGAAVAMRAQLKQALPDTKISFNDLIVMATSRALAQHPEINAYWDGKTIVFRGDIHVGVAVAVEDGLLVPVVRHTDQRTLKDIAITVRDLGTRARDKKLAPDEITGSTFTVTNLGMFGIEEFSAVINPGEGAILAVGAISDEPVVKDGQIVPGKRMRMTMACDHRVMDGALAAQFLATLRGLLEQPLAMLA